jgi:hypothetical protein
MSCGSTCVPEGPRGLSAYEIWIAEGNTGTEQDFLDSLVGADGEQGEAGPAGADGTCECEVVYTSVERAPAIGGEDGIIPGTSYTVPVGGAGDYRLLYTGHADFLTQVGTITLKIMIDGVDFNSDTRRVITMGGTGSMIPFNLFGTEIPLLANEQLSVYGSAVGAGSGLAIRNCVLEISKM